MVRKLVVLVLVLSVVMIAIGGVFIGEAINKHNYVTNSLKQEKITLLLTPKQIAAGDVIDNAAEAQAAANKIATDRRGIAPTYTALEAASGGKYDPTNTKDLDYSQAMVMENSLDMAVLSFGVIQESLATGIGLIIAGIAFGVTGIVLLKQA